MRELIYRSNHLSLNILLCIIIILFILHDNISISKAADIVFLKGDPEQISTIKSGEAIPDRLFSRILIIGKIVQGDDNIFNNLLTEAESTGKNWDKYGRNVILDSNGGDVQTAMRIGNLIREKRLRTTIEQDSSCASACVIVFAGGVQRLVKDGAKIGLHRPYFANATEATQDGYSQFYESYRKILNSYQQYFSKMGINQDLVQEMSKIPSQEIVWISDEFARKTGLIGDDPTYSEWIRSKEITEKGIECVENKDAYFRCLNRNLHLPNSKLFEFCDEQHPTPPKCK